MKIILGSQSPRRRQLLAGLDIPFEAVSIDADEHFPAELQGGNIPLYISRMKARAYEKRLSAEDLLITADTIVWADNQMMGKPKDEEDAKSMLRFLSGKTHQVYTGVTFSWIEKKKIKHIEFVDRTDVTFRPLKEEEITYYVQKYKPLDKAGAYGIQEWIGYIGVESIKGSYFNVVGFPIERVYRAIQDLKKR